jgi:type I restriction enzyme S subunit
LPAVSAATQTSIGERAKALMPISDTLDRLRNVVGERKQALITAAVTGQFDVTTARSSA